MTFCQRPVQVFKVFPTWDSRQDFWRAIQWCWYGDGSIPIIAIFGGITIYSPAILEYLGSRVLTHNHMLMILHMRLGMPDINSTRKRLAEEKEAPELLEMAWATPFLVVAGCKGWSTWVCPAFSSLSHSWGIYRTFSTPFSPRQPVGGISSSAVVCSLTQFVTFGASLNMPNLSLDFDSAIVLFKIGNGISWHNSPRGMNKCPHFGDSQHHLKWLRRGLYCTVAFSQYL